MGKIGSQYRNLYFTFLLLIGCDLPNQNQPQLFLELTTNFPYDKTSQAHAVEYPLGKPHSYVHIYIKSNPRNRIHFASPIEYGVWFQGSYHYEPIIQHSVIVKDDSTSQQLVYLNQSMIGELLPIYAIAEDGNYHTIEDSIFLILR